MENPVDKIQRLLQEAERIAQTELGLTNIYYNERFIELFTSHLLGHTYGNNTQGGDALEPSGLPTEYKAINLRSKTKKGTFQFHWLSKNKLKKYKQTENMYFVIRDGVTISRIYQVPTKNILPLLERKSTHSKNIGGHAGFDVKKMLENYGGKQVFPDLEK